MSDDQLATLSKKDIKKIRKSNSSKINYKYKKRYFKEKGIRNIEITGDGFFYIESISSIRYKNGANYTETSWAIPYNDREFLINRFIENNPKISTLRKEEESKITVPEIKTDHFLMTETLAKVYLEQKKFSNAIKAYEILSLKYPEKSGFFADQIKKIKILQNIKS